MNQANLSTTRIVHLAFMASVVVYGVILNLLLASTTASGKRFEIDPGTLQLLGNVLPVVYIAGLVLFTRFLKYRRVASPMGASMQQQYQTAHIVHLAFIESGAIYGLILVFMGAPLNWFYVAAGTALVLMALSLPTESRYQEYVARVTGRVY